jgi:hypothetical protein
MLVRVLDAILFVLLVVGSVLALPIWWWLFGTPFVRLWKWYHNGKRSDPARSSVTEIV